MTILDYRALATLKHPGSALDYLRNQVHVTFNDNHQALTPAQLKSALSGKDAVLSMLEDRFDEELLRACPQLKVIANVAVGFDNVDVPAATAHGVIVCNTPGVLDNTTADMAFALLLAAARRVAEADSYIRKSQWREFRFDLLLGHDVHGKTLGIIGLGRIGQCVARRARGFDMKVLYSQRNQAKKDTEEALAATHVPLDELLGRCDFVSINCPLTKQTHHLLADREFALMKKDSILVNTARGAIVDEAALVRALQSGAIAGAGLDVFENEPQPAPPLLSMPNVVLAPHIGSASLETREAMVSLAAEGLVTALSGRLPDNAVNKEAWPLFSKRLLQKSGLPGQ